MAQTVNVFLPNAPTVINYTLIPSASYSPNDLTLVTSVFGVDGFSSAEITVTTGPNNSGNIDVYVQRQLSDGVTFDSIMKFAQITNAMPNAARTIGFVHGGNLETSASQSIAASILATTMSGNWRIFVGLSAVAQTFGVFANFWQ
jgi:hypothetical protein